MYSAVPGPVVDLITDEDLEDLDIDDEGCDDYSIAQRLAAVVAQRPATAAVQSGLSAPFRRVREAKLRVGP